MHSGPGRERQRSVEAFVSTYFNVRGEYELNWRVVRGADADAEMQRWRDIVAQYRAGVDEYQRRAMAYEEELAALTSRYRAAPWPGPRRHGPRRPAHGAEEAHRSRPHPPTTSCRPPGSVRRSSSTSPRNLYAPDAQSRREHHGGLGEAARRVRPTSGADRRLRGDPRATSGPGPFSRTPPRESSMSMDPPRCSCGRSSRTNTTTARTRRRSATTPGGTRSPHVVGENPAGAERGHRGAHGRCRRDRDPRAALHRRAALGGDPRLPHRALRPPGGAPGEETQHHRIPHPHEHDRAVIRRRTLDARGTVLARSEREIRVGSRHPGRLLVLLIVLSPPLVMAIGAHRTVAAASEPQRRRVLPNRLEQRHEVLGRDAGLDVVHGVEDESAARPECPHPLADLLRMSSRACRTAASSACRRRRPRRRCGRRTALERAGSMPAADDCTGFRMSKPASMKSGISRSTEPQEWMNVFHGVCAWIQSLTPLWNGL